MLVRELIARRSQLAKSAWIELIERSNLKYATAIHLTSRIEASELEQFGWQLPFRAVIPNGVDEPAARHGKVAAEIREIASQQPLILFFGRLSWKKGLDRLLRAFARTRLGKLAIVGTDDENFAVQLQTIAQSLAIEDRVRVLPRTVVGFEKEQLFAAARLLVLPSYSENFGNTVLEAMRRGVPVVVTPEVGAAEVVCQSGGGLVVEGEPEPLAAAISKMAENDELARSMGEAGKRHVVAHCTWATVAEQMESLYLSLRP
jgi:glycosyltransferase involved in cell wall biosynthesis